MYRCCGVEVSTGTLGEHFELSCGQGWMLIYESLGRKKGFSVD